MVDRFIARHNIEHFRELISKETDEGKLKTLRRIHPLAPDYISLYLRRGI
jgi:hypothetical protein